MADHFLDKGNAAMKLALQNREFPYLYKSISNPPFPPTPNKTLAVLVPSRIWAVKYGGDKEKKETLQSFNEFFDLQEKYGHTTFGPARDDCEQNTTNHFIQYSGPFTTALVCGRRLNDEVLVDYANLWFARELYIWQRVDYFKTGRVICAGARTRDKPDGEPVCENPIRNYYWQNYLGVIRKNRGPLSLPYKEGWRWTEPVKPKLAFPLEVRFDVNQKRVLTSTGVFAGSIKRSWPETDYTANEDPSFKWPDDGVNYPLLEMI